MIYDVIVVGGGPAGSSTAFHLAKRDVNVLLLDRNSFPRDKICGDGIAPRSVRMLYKMGLQEEVEGRFNRFNGFIFAGAGRSVLKSRIPDTPRFPDHGYVIRRLDLDQMLLDNARRAGTEVWEECKVTSPIVDKGRVTGVRATRNGEPVELEARVVVGADGPRSTLGRSMNLLVDDPVYLGFSLRQYFSGVDVNPDYLEIHPERSISPGSAWLFPVTRDGVANVGVGAMLYHMRKYNINLHDFLRRFTMQSAQVAPRMKNAEPISPPRGELLRVGLGGSRVECPGMILVGDAASLTNPISGEGISYALESGEMAADHILGSRMDGHGMRIDPERDSFRDKLVARYEHYFEIGTRCIRYANRPTFMRALIGITSRRDRYADSVIRALMYLRH